MARCFKRFLEIGVMFACVTAVAQGLQIPEPPAPGPSTYRARRAAAMVQAANALWLIRSVPKGVTAENGLRQDPLFYYLTGLDNAVGSLLVLDGPRGQARLFTPDPGQLRGFLSLLSPPYAYVDSADASKQSGLENIAPWNEFESFVDGRLRDDATLTLRGPFRAKPQSPTAGIVGQNELLLWEGALRARWPQAKFEPAPDANALRSIKDPYEIAILRRVAELSGAALRTAFDSVREGRRQRESEVDVVNMCVRAGGNGASFWPWIQAGQNSKFTRAVQSLADYRYLDRVMQKGELVRVDLGCAYQHYEGDVGRTLPVSGRFEPGQREAWDLFVAAYRAGLAAFRPGATSDRIFSVWQDVFRQRASQLRTPLAQRTAAAAIAASASEFWQIHGVGLAAAEGLVTTLQPGQVVAFEPILIVGDLGLYLEDMVLITPSGAEVLTKDLPYTAAEIEKAMRR
jgi:Xaa-Pro aminopeptidase